MSDKNYSEFVDILVAKDPSGSFDNRRLIDIIYEDVGHSFRVNVQGGYVNCACGSNVAQLQFGYDQKNKSVCSGCNKSLLDVFTASVLKKPRYILGRRTGESEEEIASLSQEVADNVRENYALKGKLKTVEADHEAKNSDLDAKYKKKIKALEAQLLEANTRGGRRIAK